MTPTEQEALTVARTLAELGVPIFLAYPAMEGGQWDPAGGHGGCGYWLPKNWEKTSANPRYLEAWKPGMAVCAVMGKVLDLVDLDPRNGGNPASLNGTMPVVYGVAATPSEGWHGFIKTLGVRSRDAVLPGIDIKAGINGEGHGFAFIAPTRKLSKATAEIGDYRWVTVPAAERFTHLHDDHSGTNLAAIVQQAHGAKRKPTETDQNDTEPRDWLTAETIPKGSRYPWLRSYAGWLRRNKVHLPEARILMRQRWEACEQPPDYRMPWDDAEQLLEDIYGRYAAGTEETVTTIGDEWPIPTPLAERYPPPLPVDACGPIIGPLVDDIGRALQVPTDLVINMILSILSTSTQGRWLVRVSDDWTEILSISSTSVAGSGERKSPILSIPSTVLGRLETEFRTEASYDVAWRAEEIKLAEARVQEARKAAQKDRTREIDLQAEIETLNGLTPLHLPRLLADDATPEALLRLLAEQQGTIGVISAEPGFFTTLAGRYSSGVANLDGVLKATSGEPIRVDRVGRDPLLIERPCLTISVCIQPGLLKELGKRPELRYAGFLARFLYVMPTPMVGKRILSITSTTPIKKALLDLFFSHTEKLTRFAHSRRYQNQLTELTELTLDPDATTLFDRFRTDLEPRLATDLATIADWGSKLPGTTVRIAAALTLFTKPEATTIERDVMADAIRLAHAYIPHAQAVLDTIRGQGDPNSHARDILAIIQRHGWSEFTLRQIARQLANTSWVKDERGRAAEVIAEELETLIDYGHIRPLPEEERTGPGRKPSPRYEVNPAHLGGD